jgi:hypothetical protein
MAKYAVVLGLILLAAPASTQDLQSYPPSKPTAAPTFVNAEVVRVNTATGVAVFRSESGEDVVAAGPEVTSGLTLRPGQKVLVVFRSALGADGRESRVVTAVREASPTSGEPARAARAASGNVRTVRVLRTDPRRRTVTVFDDQGHLAVLPVSRTLGDRFSTLNAGDTVALTLAGLPANGGLGTATVTSFLPANAASFGLPGVFPPLTGTFVRANGNEVTLNTTAGLVTFPVSGGVLSNFSGVRPGENLSLSFDVTTASNAARGAGGPDAVRPASLTGGSAGVRTATVTGVAPAVPESVPFTASGAPQGRTPIAPNMVSPQAPGLAGQPNAQGQIPGQGVGVAGQGVGVPGQGAGVPGQGVGVPGQGVGVTPGAGAGTTGVPSTPGQAAPQAQGGTAGATAGAGTAGVAGVGPVVVGGGPTTPFTSTVPSVGSAAPVVTAVLPPAVAKAPQSADEVGSMRDQGVRDLDAAAVAMAAVANDIDVAWARFKSQCLGGTTAAQRTSGREWYILAQDQVKTPGDDACRATHTELLGRVKGFISQLDIVEDAARKADVLPAQVREVMDRHRLR